MEAVRRDLRLRRPCHLASLIDGGLTQRVEVPARCLDAQLSALPQVRRNNLPIAMRSLLLGWMAHVASTVEVAWVDLSKARS